MKQLSQQSKHILCVPLDPVHDVGIKLINAELQKHGHRTELLSPDLPLEAIVKKAMTTNYDFILVSRTLGYGVAELLARFVDQMDAAGVRDHSKIVIGGKAVSPELAAELGFDKGFDEHASYDSILAYIEGTSGMVEDETRRKVKKNITAGHSYVFHHTEIESLLERIAEKTLRWSDGVSTPGIKRSRLRQGMLKETDKFRFGALQKQYRELCDTEIVDANSEHRFPKGVRFISEMEQTQLSSLLTSHIPKHQGTIQYDRRQPLVFKFLGSGCPMMDIVHGKICERWGIDGFLVINPSWEARYEGLLEGMLTHENDGTITSLENIQLMKRWLDPATLLTIRAHRGLNTAETTLLAGEGGADLTKINLVYGSLGAGTDPERLTADGIESIKIAGQYNMAFDIPGNDELSGVPAWKTLAGLLINVMLGKKLGAKAILKPLFCCGPHIVLNGQMQLNYVDYNAAKILALKEIVDCPVWPGEPIAFMTQTEDRVQSANATSYHAALAASLGVDAITIASTDEAYSRGPICIASRIDSIRAVTDAFRFMGNANITPTPAMLDWKENLIRQITETLRAVALADHLPDAINKGLLGNAADGAYPGTFGKGTVTRNPLQ
ncbi:MAG: cobalamin B12-binding domain-containing protein [Bacteroidetes bacterium]|nr:cobalamin B12-binding domain-containing protein [Bacteroidota bacterium]